MQKHRKWVSSRFFLQRASFLLHSLSLSPVVPLQLSAILFSHDAPLLPGVIPGPSFTFTPHRFFSVFWFCLVKCKKTWFVFLNRSCHNVTNKLGKKTSPVFVFFTGLLPGVTKLSIKAWLVGCSDGPGCVRTTIAVMTAHWWPLIRDHYLSGVRSNSPFSFPFCFHLKRWTYSEFEDNVVFF